MITYDRKIDLIAAQMFEVSGEAGAWTDHIKRANARNAPASQEESLEVVARFRRMARAALKQAQAFDGKSEVNVIG